MAIGTQIRVYDGLNYYYIQHQPTRGFQSSVDLRPHIGLPTKNNVDIEITWTNGLKSNLDDVEINQIISISQSDVTYSESNNKTKITSKALFERVNSDMKFSHVENIFIDFNKNRLLPHMLSTPGPKIVKGDINGDGLEEILIPGSKDNKSRLFKWEEQNLKLIESFELDEELPRETIEPLFFDADGDGDLDLYAANGGVEFSRFMSFLQDKLYINDGKGNFSLSENKLPTEIDFFNSGTVEVSDIDGDGDLDLFVGERLISDSYGLPGSGVLLLNNGEGSFTDVTKDNAAEFLNLGMITDAIFVDIDNDKDEDLIVVGEFMGINLFYNQNGTFTSSSSNLTNYKGWWQTIDSADFNGDGLMDIIVGNHGLNSRFSANEKNPIRLYLNDYDGNEQLDPVLTFRSEDGKFYPYDLRHNLIDQMKPLKKVFPNYKSFRSANINDMFNASQIEESLKLDVNILSSSVFINKGNDEFVFYELPQKAQFSPIYSFLIQDFDKDGDMDVIAGGNLYKTKPEIGRYDASFGVFLENNGNGVFKIPSDGHGFNVNGEVRSLLFSNSNVIVGRNSNSLVQFKYLYD
ncbi:MAG: FG-GAP-like repeat-containing protein, partial [Bacteroidota bacterium]|nr:FG-GAP-like repeat-containing protein [Bacteroidota bacterium]